jgi:hypothetical protein
VLVLGIAADDARGTERDDAAARGGHDEDVLVDVAVRERGDVDLGEPGSHRHLDREAHGPAPQRVPHGHGGGRALPRDHAVAREAEGHLDARGADEVQERDDPEGCAGPGDRDELAPAQRVAGRARDDGRDRDDPAERGDDADEAGERVPRRRVGGLRVGRLRVGTDDGRRGRCRDG